MHLILQTGVGENTRSQLRAHGGRPTDGLHGHPGKERRAPPVPGRALERRVRVDKTRPQAVGNSEADVAVGGQAPPSAGVRPVGIGPGQEIPVLVSGGADMVHGLHNAALTELLQPALAAALGGGLVGRLRRRRRRGLLCAGAGGLAQGSDNAAPVVEVTRGIRGVVVGLPARRRVGGEPAAGGGLVRGPGVRGDEAKTTADQPLLGGLVVVPVAGGLGVGVQGAILMVVPIRPVHSHNDVHARIRAEPLEHHVRTTPDPRSPVAHKSLHGDAVWVVHRGVYHAALQCGRRVVCRQRHLEGHPIVPRRGSALLQNSARVHEQSPLVSCDASCVNGLNLWDSVGTRRVNHRGVHATGRVQHRWGCNNPSLFPRQLQRRRVGIRQLERRIGVPEQVIPKAIRGQRCHSTRRICGGQVHLRRDVCPGHVGRVHGDSEGVLVDDGDVELSSEGCVGSHHAHVLEKSRHNGIVHHLHEGVCGAGGAVVEEELGG
mmetsp:Transcript_122265/g.280067  ORF Transcript_122265/g.280067 Transcript_122265/m.280067 type:complete len:489 (-) Transcript_122265:2104-3570(-)